jgi:hypothetical protein
MYQGPIVIGLRRYVKPFDSVDYPFDGAMIMISEKQLEANRRNAQHSTGPKTAEGKAVVANNALRHGLRSQRIVTAGEDQAEYDDLRNELIAQFAPVGILEIMLTDRIAAGFWRLSRTARMETEMLETLQSEHREKADNARARLKRLLNDRLAASERPAGRPSCGRLPFKGFEGAKAAWDATEDGKLYTSGNWPDDPDLCRNRTFTYPNHVPLHDTPGPHHRNLTLVG